MLLIWGTIQARITGYEKKVLFVISQVANQGVEGLTYLGSDVESVAKLVIALWSRGFVRALIRGFLPSLINWLIFTFWKQHKEIIFLSSIFKIYSLKGFLVFGGFGSVWGFFCVLGFFSFFSQALKTQGWKASPKQHLPDIWYYLETASDKWTLSLKSCEEFYYSTLKIFWGKGGCKLLTMWSSLQVGAWNVLMYWDSHVATARSRESSLQFLTNWKFHPVTVRNAFLFVLCLLKGDIFAWNLVFKHGIVWFCSLSSHSTGCLHRVSLWP